jgi:hypothetical protein
MTIKPLAAVEPLCKPGQGGHDWDNPGGILEDLASSKDTLVETCVYCSVRRYSRGSNVVGYKPPFSLETTPAWEPKDILRLAREFRKQVAPHEWLLTPDLQRALLTKFAVKVFFTAQGTTRDDLRHLINELERELSLEEHP